MTHIHGCGHPVRPVILCDEPLALITSGYLFWNEEHEMDLKMKRLCVCFFCWDKKDKRNPA